MLRFCIVKGKGACTHTGFLPELDPAPVVEFFTRTGITAAGGSLILNAAQRRCLCIDRLRYLKHRQIQIRVQVATQYVETDKPHKEDVCAASGLSSSSPAHKFAGPATRPDRLRVKAPIYLHCIRRWSRTRLRFCRCVCKRPKAHPRTGHEGSEGE